MEIVGRGSGKETLSTLPRPKPYLNKSAKKYYNEIGRILITAEILKETHLISLNLLAVNCAIWEFSVREINKKNDEEPGSGYIQKYKTGATNITTELGLKRSAEKSMIENLAAFGMDPQSEKKLTKKLTDPAQLDVFSEFNNRQHG